MDRNTLISAIFAKKSLLCVGLDPEPAKIPKHLLAFDDPIFEFNRAIIEATREYCVAYKPNLAFYEALGPKGWQTLEKTVRAIPDTHFKIADAKRGDIGNTSKKYAEAFFNQLPFDAITIAPYMGEDSIAPFLEYTGKWVVILGLTSNKGSADFQQLALEESGAPLWETVLTTTKQYGTSENTMYVIGATHPESIARVRELVPDHFLLVPGVGAQGGDLQAICAHGLNADAGLLINASRSILYAGAGRDFAEKAGEEARRMAEEMALLPFWNRREP